MTAQDGPMTERRERGDETGESLMGKSLPGESVPGGALDRFSAKQASAPSAAVPASRTAVVVVDMVNDYLEADGAMPVDSEHEVLTGVQRLVGLARSAGAPVVWVRPGHTESMDALFRKRIEHAHVHSHGAQIHATLDVRDHDRVVLKRRYSAFFQTDLDLYLREHRIERVIVAGVALNICVRSTVHDAFFNGYDVWVPPEACRATGDREEQSTLYDIATHFGDVMTLQDIEDRWAPDRPGVGTGPARPEGMR